MNPSHSTPPTTPRFSRRAVGALLAVVAITPFLSSCTEAVPIGGTRNFMGTGNLLGGTARENFWLGVQQP